MTVCCLEEHLHFIQLPFIRTLVSCYAVEHTGGTLPLAQLLGPGRLLLHRAIPGSHLLNVSVIALDISYGYR